MTVHVIESMLVAYVVASVFGFALPGARRPRSFTADQNQISQSDRDARGWS